jgi:hypothetical protein
MPIQKYEPYDTYRLFIFMERELSYLVGKTADARKKDEAFFLPKSRIEKGEDTREGTFFVAEFKVPDWLAEQNGLIGDGGVFPARRASKPKDDDDEIPF